MNCPTDATPEAAACLRAVPVDQLIASQATPIATIIDGELLPEPIIDRLKAGNFHP